MKKEIIDLGFVVKEFTDSFDDTHKVGSVKRYIRGANGEIFFNGTQYFNGLDEVISIQDAVIKTLESRGVLTKKGLIIKSRAKDYLDIHTYGKTRVAYLLLDENLLGGERMYLSFVTNNRNESYEILQNFIDSLDPHKYYGVKMAISTKIAIVLNTFISKLDLLAKIK